MTDIIVNSADDQKILEIVLKRNGYNVKLDRDPAVGTDIKYHVRFEFANVTDDSKFKCDSHHTEQRVISVDFGVLGTAPRTKTIQTCWGTKEREECTCDGDKRKCNFYKLNEEGRLV